MNSSRLGEPLRVRDASQSTSAWFSHRPRGIDLAWPIIRLVECLGLANVKRLPVAKAACSARATRILRAAACGG